MAHMANQMPAYRIRLRQWMLLTTSYVAFGGCIAWFSSTVLAQNSPAGNPEGLVGLWGAEQILTPMVSGELIIDARGAEWQATVGGFNALVQRANDRVAFTSTAL